MNSVVMMKSLGLFRFDKERIYRLVLKTVHDQMIYCYQGRQRLSSIDRCVPYRLVVLLTNECGDIGMAYRWDVRVHLHWTWPTSELFLLSKFSPMRYGYKYPSDLRPPRRIASNSLHLGTRLSEFLIQWRKVAGCSQVLDLSVRAIYHI